MTGGTPNHLDYRKLRLAMPLPGKNRHYRLCDVQRRHYNETARRCGYGPDMEAIIEDIPCRLPGVIETVAARLPADFPGDVFEAITEGMQRSPRRLYAQSARASSVPLAGIIEGTNARLQR